MKLKSLTILSLLLVTFYSKPAEAGWRERFAEAWQAMKTYFVTNPSKTPREALELVGQEYIALDNANADRIKAKYGNIEEIVRKLANGRGCCNSEAIKKKGGLIAKKPDLFEDASFNYYGDDGKKYWIVAQKQADGSRRWVQRGIYLEGEEFYFIGNSNPEQLLNESQIDDVRKFITGELFKYCREKPSLYQDRLPNEIVQGVLDKSWEVAEVEAQKWAKGQAPVPSDDALRQTRLTIFQDMIDKWVEQMNGPQCLPEDFKPKF